MKVEERCICISNRLVRHQKVYKTFLVRIWCKRNTNKQIWERNNGHVWSKSNDDLFILL